MKTATKMELADLFAGFAIILMGIFVAAIVIGAAVGVGALTFRVVAG